MILVFPTISVTIRNMSWTFRGPKKIFEVMGKKETVIPKRNYYLLLNNTDEALREILHIVVGPPVQDRCGETGQALLEACQDS